MITFGYNNKSNSVIRIICSLALAFLFIIISSMGKSPLTMLAYVVAAFFVAAGLVAIAYAFLKKRKDRDFSLSVLGGAVEIILGLVIFFCAKAIGYLLYYLVAAFVVLFALYHIIVFVSMRKVVKVNIVFYVVPALAIIAAIFLCGFRNKGVLAGYVAGVALALYGISELVAYIKVKRAIRKDIEESEPSNVDVQDAVVIEEEK